MSHHAIFDTEIIGLEKPVFLLCVKIVETKESFAFWYHKRGDLKKCIALMERKNLTWVSFNGNRFDIPLLAAWLNGKDNHAIKQLANAIINDRLMPWDAMAMAGCGGMKLDIDHIDLIEPAPGVMISLKTYAGRMNYPSMIDLPFHFDKDLTPKEQKVLQVYCQNDLGVTETLFKELQGQIALRVRMGAEYDMDFRSKSDAQMSEAILKKMSRLGKTRKEQPNFVKYETPSLIKTTNKALLELIKQLEDQKFTLTKGSPELPKWLETPIEINGGKYKVGIGGLHSQHDKSVYHEATDDYIISDFDGKSYYPTWIINAGYIPDIGGKGKDFLAAYKSIYDRRIAALAAGDKVTADSLKIALNGAFGKLGSTYCAFYSPDLLIAVTITGQLNLLCLIEDLTRQKGIQVLSANTDGIVVGYSKSIRDKVLATIARNSKQTGMIYEEKQYKKLAMKDVNNYIAVTSKDEIKAKGLYAEPGLMKNPTAPVCSHAAAEYLLNGTAPEKFIKKTKKLIPFLSIRNVKGGASQNGTELGRVARWYMTTDTLPPIRYVSNGNIVPKTEGAKACMILPEAFPKDLNHQWYINEVHEILRDIGVKK